MARVHIFFLTWYTFQYFLNDFELFLWDLCVTSAYIVGKKNLSIIAQRCVHDMQYIRCAFMTERATTHCQSEKSRPNGQS